MTSNRKLPEVETYLGFAAVQRQQLCQQILSAIDAIKLPKKKNFAPQDVTNILEDLKASLFKNVQQVMEKDAQATAGMLTNTLTGREEADGGHIFSNKASTSAEGQKGLTSSAAAKDTSSKHDGQDAIMARHALHDIQQCHASILTRVESFRSDLQQQQHRRQHGIV